MKIIIVFSVLLFLNYSNLLAEETAKTLFNSTSAVTPTSNKDELKNIITNLRFVYDSPMAYKVIFLSRQNPAGKKESLHKFLEDKYEFISKRTQNTEKDNSVGSRQSAIGTEAQRHKGTKPSAFSLQPSVAANNQQLTTNSQDNLPLRSPQSTKERLLYLRGIQGNNNKTIVIYNPGASKKIVKVKRGSGIVIVPVTDKRIKSFFEFELTKYADNLLSLYKSEKLTFAGRKKLDNIPVLVLETIDKLPFEMRKTLYYVRESDYTLYREQQYKANSKTPKQFFLISELTWLKTDLDFDVSDEKFNIK